MHDSDGTAPSGPIQVALVTTSFPLLHGSVSGVFIERLAHWLSRAVSVSVVTPCGVTSGIDTRDGRAYTVHCFSYAPRRWSVLAHQPGGIPVALQRRRWLLLLLPFFLGSMLIACVRASRKVDVVHANWSLSGLIAGIAGFLTRTPVITTLRGEDVTRAAQSGMYERLLRWCLRSNQRVVAVSEAIQKWLVGKYPDYATRILFVPNGVEPDLLRRQLGLPESHGRGVIRLIAVGSLIPRKDIATIVQAIAALNSLQGVELTVVGDGPERVPLEALAERLGMRRQIRFVGNVPADKVFAYLRAADALVLSSYSEGRPNVVLEAMALGIPVIATAIPGVTELVRGWGEDLLFQPGDSVGLAACIRRIWIHPNLYLNAAQAGRDYVVANRLLWPQTAERYLDIYRQVREEFDVRPDFST